MKKIIVFLVIIIIACYFAFSTGIETDAKSENKFSIGIDIGCLNQGFLLRYGTGRWFDIEGSFRLPVTMYIIEGFDTLANKTVFDPYTILSPELSITGYFMPVQAGCFGLGLGLNGTVFANTNGPWTENAGTSDEARHKAGTILGVYLKAAAKLQFDFNNWGFSISGFCPVFGTVKDIGDINLGNAMSGIFKIIYNNIRVGFDFKL